MIIICLLVNYNQNNNENGTKRLPMGAAITIAFQYISNYNIIVLNRFILRGKLEPNTIHRFGGCSFELEICFLPNFGVPTPTKSILKNGPLNVQSPSSQKKKDGEIVDAYVGIRRKRLKGDSWCYKKVCEQVLALTATDFKTITESTV